MKDLQLNWQDLIKPKRVVIDEKSSTEYYGKFICEPLEKGYGITLGNALRRVLLSSIKGPAITSIKVEGVLHEFSTIPGVKEDVTQIILNLKGLQLKVHTFEKQTITISAMGECDVTAGDIITTHQVDVLNPDHHIATLSEGSKLEMEMTVEVGYGYEAVESRGDIQTSIGLIPLDAIYSPVRKVNYSITNARVGRRTDYEKLNLEIWTNGTVIPEDAVAYAAKIIKEQLTVFINFDEEEVDAIVEVEDDKEISGTEEILFTTIEDMDLSARSLNCLRKAEITYVGELIQKSEDDLLNLENFGKRSLLEIRERIEEMELSLGSVIDVEAFESEKLKKLETVESS
ncbi:MAG: DNA-directed RNA polymerase subunit alpha [Deltaproteobacteria bacterium]|nr:DNA-directed RNA polymerase subunit alpha [Candidatus Dadabacteria bacterium]TDJ07141.1 MAG: DNA-directed RNA polymerase subunit alpha [Deltaproteobacteria bacterium]